jgi:hypothetical protein
MTDTHKSLTAMLQQWFELSFSDLPDDLKYRVKREYFPLSWDKLTSEQRRRLALQWDNEDESDEDKNLDLLWDIFEQMDDYEVQLTAWNSVPAPSASDLHLKERRINELTQKLAELKHQANQTPPPESSSEIGSAEWRKQNARKAANAKHDKPGGSREKKKKIQEIWASGKYTTKDICAEEECAALGMSFGAARKALNNL